MQSVLNDVALPRLRGGVSDTVDGFVDVVRSSPRQRGCFLSHAADAGNEVVFPAPAGVFLNAQNVKHPRKGLPRASGGVSKGIESKG